MFKKKIYLFLIIVIGLMAISAVSAADDNATDIISIDDNEEVILEENSNENVLNIENDDNKLSTNSTGTFTELNNDINGNDKDTVELTQNNAYDSTGDSSLKNGKVLKSDYKPETASNVLTAEELKNTTIDVNVTTNGKDTTITVELDKNASGFVKYNLTGEENHVLYMNVEEGQSILEYALTPGNYTVEITYLGDDKYNKNTTTQTFTVDAIPLENTTIDADVQINGKDITITVNVNPNATGLVQYTLTGAENYTLYVGVTDGQSILEDTLDLGEYTMEITYLGDDKYNTNTTTQTFTIAGHIKNDTEISSTAEVENSTVTITTNVDSNATGYVTLEILSQTFIVPVENGNAVFTYDFNIGTYTADITYLGDDNFNNATTTATFTVTNQSTELKNTTVDVDVETSENNVTITATVDTLASGLVEFNIDGKAAYIVVNNGIAVYDVVLPAGDYNVEVTYLGDSRYNANRTSRAFTVTDHIKKNTTLTLDIRFDEYTVIVIADVDPNATGFVEFTLNGNTIISKVDEGKAFMDTILFPDEYTVYATYLGDNDFNTNTTESTFTVEEIPLQNTTIEANTTINGKDITITVNINPNATGFVKYNITGEESYVLYMNVIDGQSVIEEVLTPGDYTVEITYLGDDKYNANTTTQTFTVDAIPLENTTIKANTTINENNITITVNINPNATGFVKYNITGEENYTLYMDVNDGQSILEGTLTPGDYTVEITYLGDDKYNANTTTQTFTVDAIPLENTTIEANTTINENNITITVNINPNATGFVKYNITGEESYVLYMNVIDGQSVIEEVLTPGDYTVEITYLGDANYNANTTTETFTIVGHIKNDTEISSTATVENSTVTITTNVDSNATGYVTLEILSQTFIVPVENGNAVFTYDFNIGTYSVNVVYLGDNNFNSAATTTSFTVTNQSTELINTTVDVDVETSENNVTITATIDSLASGLVEFNIDGKVVYIAVNNGIAVYDVVLPGGDYNVEVTYLGDSRYNANRTSKAFTVTDHIKNNTTLTLDIRFDEYTVIIIADVDPNATGFVEFTLNGNTIISKVDEGKAFMDTILFPDEYTVYATYLGDNDFNTNTTESTFTVEEIPLQNTTIDANITINENNITITANIDPNATGFILYNITGAENYTIYVKVTDGQSIFEDTLTPGDYTVEITYLGDDKYNANTTTQTFTIVGHIKNDTEISSTATVEGNTVTITTNVDSNATGHVTLGILGQTFIVPVENGIAVFTYDFNPGVYTADITYLGDYNFNNATTTTTFTLTNQSSELKNTTINVDVETAGNDVTITATIDSLASGLVEFNINGNAVYIAVNNGNAIYNVILPAGDYNVAVTYLGDSRFNSNSTSKEFTVSGPVKKDTNMTAEVSVKELNVAVSITLDKDATGFVEFIINEEIVYLPAKDGKVVLNTTLKPGKYVLIANYLGDDDFNENSTLVEFTVNKVETQIITSKVSTVYGTSKNIVITLTDVNGNLLIGKNVTVKFNNKAYTKTVDSNGQVSVAIGKTLVPKTYTASITFAGDDTYLKSSNTAKVVVSKATPTITAKAATYKTSVKTKKYSVTLKGINSKVLKNYKISIKVNGKTYSAKTNSKGTATFKITGLTKKAKYIGLITYKGNTYYKEVSKKVKITLK